MKKAGFKEEIDKVEKDICPFCNTKINQEDFKDELSRKEYEISGLCQMCQDNFFNHYDTDYSQSI